jgi:cytochrome c biogenesis protein CcdA
MDIATIPVISAVWLGILTSISPCPLASNIAAVSYIVKGTGKPLLVFLTGIIYTLGRVITYSFLGGLISTSLLNIPRASQFLQTVMPKVLGPVLIITGFFLLEIISFSLPGTSFSEKAINRFKNSGIIGAMPLGILFALAFCPLSAALFFGSLIPLAISNASPIMLPFLYGVGTGLPVLLFAFVIALGVKNISRMFHKVTKTEYWVRRTTAVILIIIGIYYVMVHIFHINFY